MKLFLREEGSELARSLWDSDAGVATSWLTFAEASAAIAAAKRSRRLTSVAAASATRALEEEWHSITALLVDGEVARAAGVVAVRRRLRSLDAVHLASALPLQAGPTIFVTFDAHLAGAARSEGFAVAGAV